MNNLPQEKPGPSIAIAGRPNVGKSTLFNRIIGNRKAVVSNIRGTTRDVIFGKAEWHGRLFTLIDTGGFEFSKKDSLTTSIQFNIRRALQMADSCALICDGKEGLVPADQIILEELRKQGKPIIVIVNKLDERLMIPTEFYSLGVNQIIPVSALHGRGIAELLDSLVKTIPTSTDLIRETPDVTIAIVGRQNVGKSSLLNAILEKEMALVNQLPGTTRDALDTYMHLDGTTVKLIDTAGLRYRRKLKSPVDLFSMSRTRDAIKQCDVAIVTLDSSEHITRDDRRIIADICCYGCGFILLFNKWDLVKGISESQLRESLSMHRALPFALFSPILTASAKTGIGVRRALFAAIQVFRFMQHGVSESDLNSLLQRAWAAQPPPRFKGRPIKLITARWRKSRPALVELKTNPLGCLPLAYKNYLLKFLYSNRKLSGIPIKIVNQTRG